ncbi:hypothetical protein FPZ43_11650 [Mucilaginibacter pallidiroseus]|uniref:Uncharacterized protein n=1 Tax=Mucilaginibacter pallidiroseus TaxID=2599295 RepID=A0A563UCA6_9SPHI|nr:hypothetical protein [Mucilaginibacter pallidiroseus]TWR28913.1 hypothetical protein FPZ43_11650 [Mucilaginibacter pallidiroseus]
MENYLVTVTLKKQTYQFEIGEYLHHQDERCKFKVFENGKMVASFEPDAHQYLHVCQNPGNLDERVLNLLADKIEAHHPHQRNH